ncbi:MAG: alpha-amylase family glycosyl hydrolase [Myxococcota bacterium]
MYAWRRWAVMTGLLWCACRSSGPVRAPAAVGDADVFYEVFVRSFHDSNGDGVGDIRGILEKLDHLNDGRAGEGEDLEVGGLWLTPINPSPSYHGYDVTDYLGVNPALGTEADVRQLFDECHRRGMRVLLDLVVNHTSSQHPWFQAARVGPESPTRDYYLWRHDDPGWTQPWPGGRRTWHPLGDGTFFYGLFWSGMPDLNYGNPAVADAMVHTARTWLQRGADGFRVDAARYLYESPDGELADLPATHAFFRRLRAEVAAVKPSALLVAEAWTERARVLEYRGHDDEFHQAFDFDLASAITSTILGEHGDALRTELAKIAETRTPWSYEATFLSNHDMDRLVSRLPSLAAVKAAVTLLLMLPGTPFLYYGDEVGLPQGSGHGDEAKRTPMPWTAAGGFTTGTPWYPYAGELDTRNVATQRRDPASLLSHHRKLIRLRRELGIPRAEAPVMLDAAHPALVVLAYPVAGVVVVVNAGSEVVEMQPVALPGALRGARSVTTVLGVGEGGMRGGQLSWSRGQERFTPYESRVLRLR